MHFSHLHLDYPFWCIFLYSVENGGKKYTLSHGSADVYQRSTVVWIGLCLRSA